VTILALDVATIMIGKRKWHGPKHVNLQMNPICLYQNMIDSLLMNPSSITMIKNFLKNIAKNIFEFCSWSDEELEELINRRNDNARKQRTKN
jgi:hypothetical protein